MTHAWFFLIAAFTLTCCSNSPGSASVPAASKLADSTQIPPAIAIDGSSTVYPVTQGIVSAFSERTKTKVTVGFSGTGGGFRKFCRGETLINGASRPITAREVEACRAAGIRYVELPIALDGLAVVVHPNNSWASAVTVSELKKLWEPAAQGKVKHWSQVRAGWPDQEIHLYGAGADSGTYDYFTKAIVGVEHSSRSDYTPSEDDDALVQDVAGDPNGLGFFGLAYYAKNRSRLKLLAIDDEKESNGDGPVAPSPETVGNGTYQPLMRPMFIYVDSRASERPDAAEFVRFFVRQARSIVRQNDYVPLSERGYDLVLARFDHRVLGSLFHGGGSTVGVNATDLTAGK